MPNQVAKIAQIDDGRAAPTAHVSPDARAAVRAPGRPGARPETAPPVPEFDHEKRTASALDDRERHREAWQDDLGALREFRHPLKRRTLKVHVDQLCARPPRQTYRRRCDAD